MMEYTAIAFGLSDELFTFLREIFEKYQVGLTCALSFPHTLQCVNNNAYHLILIDMTSVIPQDRAFFLSELRKIKRCPIMALVDRDGMEDAPYMVALGADVCIPSIPLLTAAAHGLSLVRLHNEYNDVQTGTSKALPFRCGDIYIDPLQRVVKVRDHPVDLRPREFSLLLYFMQNPKIVLTAEMIRENAWGADMGYNQGVAQPVYLLRQAIEADPEHPAYIETIRRVGYRFTANIVETCDNCDDTVIFM